MTDNEIREKYHKDGIADKAFNAVSKKAGGEEALIGSGIQNMFAATMEETYLMGWRDALKNAPDGNARRTGEIDREAIENAKDVRKLDISVLGLSKRVHSRLQKNGIRTIGELITKMEYGLKKVRGIGDAAYEEIVRQVREANLLHLE